MKRTLILFSVVLLAGCDPQAKRDREKLDSLLASAHIDRIEFVSWRHDTKQLTQVTNVILGTEAHKILGLLAATNRMAGKEIKDETQSVYFIDETQCVFEMVLAENGLWRFGAYRFSLRSP